MKVKNKKQISRTDQLATVAQQAGLVLMSAAFTLGMIDVAEQIKGRVIVPAQNTFAVEAIGPQGGHEEPIRREREETHQHSSSYSVNQRTAARSGKA